MKTRLQLLIVLCLSFSLQAGAEETTWIIDAEEEWTEHLDAASNVAFVKGTAAPDGEQGEIRTKVIRLPETRSLDTLTIEQSPVWQNWEPTENLGPANLGDAPILLTIGPDNYWMFGRYGGIQPKQKGKKPEPFVAEPATLEGFDIPLTTTGFANQYNAPGGLEPGLGGYHAWQSRDMVNWVHHGPVTEGFSKWATTAEHVDGKTYIYYDFPNDQDPHVYVDSDLTDGKPGGNAGIALRDPSHGSDCAVIRGLDGRFHIIFEDWSPIRAQKRSWDSPLAGISESEVGTGPFTIVGNAVDARTTPTGRIETYTHPHWVKEDPDNYTTNVAEFEVHEPEQEAYGDWAAIAIGGRYYLFADYDASHGDPMSVCWFTSESIDEPFEFCDHIGKGHPDPDICFAEGQFYLATQQSTDYTSPGPWVETVEARVGVDTDGDGTINQWGDWEILTETYDYVSGFSKQVSKTPASLDLSGLPRAKGFQIEVKLTDSTENRSRPILDSIEVTFSDS